MSENSEMAIKLGFGKPNAENNEQKSKEDNTGTKETINVTTNVTTKEENTDGDKEYTEYRKVTIMLVKNYSLYRKANDKVLPNRKDYIGSSINSSRVLAANKQEVDTYFPNILGISPTDPNFIMRVKQYLNNIKIAVDELGKTFDISFHYNKKEDYYKIKSAEEKIENEYIATPKRDIHEINVAIKSKVTKLNVLESTKCALGYPINVEDYLMYRHCLLYNDIAKDISQINGNSNIRFYFKDEQKEAEKLRKYRTEVTKAKSNYVTCLADNALFDAVYIQYCVMSNLPVISSLAESKLDKEIKLDKFSAEEPVKFNKICANKDVKLIANIELLIARGELIRSQYNQNITTPEGEFIGSNMNEAVAWFKNVENTSYVNAYLNKLKNI